MKETATVAFASAGDEPADDDRTAIARLPDAKPSEARPEVGEVLVLRAAGAAESDVARRLREAGLRVRAAALEDDLVRDLLADTPALVVLELEPFDRALVDLVRQVRGALYHNAPAFLAIMRADDDARLGHTLAAGVLDVIEPPASTVLLRLKIDRFARRQPRAARTIAGFTIGHVLGRGGMGTVYEAERDGARFALKVLEAVPALDVEALVRFRREMESLRALSGPGIPRFFDAGRCGEAFYYVMELVEGRTLHALSHEAPLDEAVLRNVLCDIADALHSMHGAGFVHRDVKPANIMVSTAGCGTLVDYGLTKLMGDLTLTKTDEVCGTLVYLAPEVLRGRDASPASDAYALGMSIFHAALRESPVADTASFLAHKILVGDVPTPSEKLRDRYSADFLAVLDGLLHRDATRRLDVAAASRALDPARHAARGGGLALTLRFLNGPHEGRALAFESPRRVTIGRAIECDVTVADADVSRRHCAITVSDEGAHLSDLGSANGTRVNGLNVRASALRDGDRLRLADTDLRVELARGSR